MREYLEREGIHVQFQCRSCQDCEMCRSLIRGGAETEQKEKNPKSDGQFFQHPKLINIIQKPQSISVFFKAHKVFANKHHSHRDKDDNR